MKYLLLLTLLSWVTLSYTQHHEINEKPIMWKGNQNEIIDTTSILHAFKSGTTQGHFRYFFSSTTNEGNLSDYYANAIGGGLRYETAKYKNFQFAVSGFYFFNIKSSDLHIPDSLTGQLNRYEIGLFDIENPDNHKDMDRLEELYLKYNFKKGHVIFGRQLINNPLINLQDGRMRGTGVEGVWLDYELKKIKLEGGYLYAISPRSTTKWYSIDESIGIYPSGVGMNGGKSNYFGNLTSAGVGVISLKYKILKNLELQAWDYYLDNILNSGFFQFNYEKEIRTNKKLVFAGQLIRQDAIRFGGNEDPSKTYVEKGSKSMTFGGQIGYKVKNALFSINYNRITKHGRYLFPREWGRDPFFTFLPRERSEGFGDVHAIVAKYEQKFPKKNVKSSIGFGYVQLPDVLNFRLNKYGVPSYYQINLDVRYQFKNLCKGLESQLLIVSKFNAGETYNNPKYRFNKVNMLLINLVLNYHF
ncbi:MAG: hypothetical protein RI883_902 [Bacteroidota bacterium]|jgi:hypothetical protein